MAQSLTTPQLNGFPSKVEDDLSIQQKQVFLHGHMPKSSHASLTSLEEGEGGGGGGMNGRAQLLLDHQAKMTGAVHENDMSAKIVDLGTHLYH